jgi:hypothetical protein
MKKVVLIIMVLIGGTVVGHAQENETNKSERIKLYPIEGANSKTETGTLSPEEEIKQCQDHIEALNIKEASIRSNPEETKKATENGWFVNANATREQLNARIKELRK